jgi:hypothetical protein
MHSAISIGTSEITPGSLWHVQDKKERGGALYVFW